MCGIPILLIIQDPTEVGSSVDTVRKVSQHCNHMLIIAIRAACVGILLKYTLKRFQVQPSRASVTMKFIMKQLFDKPVRRVQKYLKVCPQLFDVLPHFHCVLLLFLCVQSPLARAAACGTLQEVREFIVSGEDPNPHTVSPLNH